MADHRDDFIIAIRYALLKKGAKQKFSLFFLILLSISIITLDKFSFSFMSSTRAVLNDFVYHISVISSQPTRLRKYLVFNIKEHYNVKHENIFLKKEIGYLKSQKFNNAFLASENEILKKALEMSEDKGLNKNFSISAKVMLDQKSPYLKSLLLNKGTNSDITKGLTVFSKDYLMGTIIETNFLSSRVLLLTDLNSKIPVIFEGSNANAILEGTGKKNKLTLNYLPENYKIEVEKIIFTSGKDGFLAAGIPVAKTYLNKKNTITIKLLGDPDQALIVNITNGQIKN